MASTQKKLENTLLNAYIIFIKIMIPIRSTQHLARQEAPAGEFFSHYALRDLKVPSFQMIVPKQEHDSTGKH
ncbi:Os11g0246950 [Oryza sativa Japonica Group]|uniref:Os11g0246950 protein n=1 Tax=Oryza sativa subsp. japonica TaxID=39947 RepID=A0A0P0Y0T2_ORYSJ|nr:hypothetical protein EE612_054469 [Oryza sativa]BAT13421.1 Os11g0246950 [Oryza sativa Japonica Group]